jgi:hypothetical protein
MTQRHVCTNSLHALVCCLAILAVAAEKSAAPAALLPPPDSAAQAKSEKTIREVYQKDYTGKSIGERRALARKLLQAAKETRDDPAARYVLLREARDIAAGAGDAAIAARAIAQMTHLYSVDPIPILLPAMQTSQSAAITPQACEAVARTCLSAMEQAIVADEYSAAARFALMAQSAAERARHVPLVLQIEERTKELHATYIEFERVKIARETLRARPDDGDANSRAGRFACFIETNWDNGLLMLAKGSDPTLRDLALADLADARDAEKRLELANGWWEQAVSRKGLARSHLQQHAGVCYRQALPKLSGINRGLAEQRLEVIDSALLKDLNLERGLTAELFRGIAFQHFVKTRLDAQIDFDWGEGAPDDSLPKDNFSLRWTGVLKPAAEGHYELIVIANEGARIWLDEKLLLDDPNLFRRRNGVRLPIELSAAPHSLKLEYWDTTGAAKMRLLWHTPGAAKDQPIPASSWYHDVTLSVGTAESP